MNHFRVFLSSPADVAHERALARQILQNLTNQPFIRRHANIQVVAWDTPGAETPMFANLTPQQAIDRHLPPPSDCDVAVFILWSRMGTPLPAEYTKADGTGYLSGTEWEFENALKSPRTKVLLYRRTEKVSTFLDDAELNERLRQRKRVEQFFSRLRGASGEYNGGWTEYITPSEFQERFENDIKSVLELLLENSPEITSHELARTPQLIRVPYPGLRAFGENDALVFFGRGRETDDLVARLEDKSNRFLCVVGASGTGKSSLIGAGLIPRLRAGAIEGSKDWVNIQFSPGELGGSPFLPLAARLVPHISDQRVSAPTLAEQLFENPASAYAICDTALELHPTWSRLLIFIDQLEELFTLVHERYQKNFAGLIDYLARHDRLQIITTLRADFLSRAAEIPELAGWLQKGHYLLVAPSWDALESMIRGPAERAGLQLEDGLIARVLADTGQEPGRLPLLAYTLEQQYRMEKNAGRLTLRGYEKLNGLRGAIGRRAEETFARLDESAQAALPLLFGELVALDPNGTVTRRRALRERIVGKAGQRLADELIGCRLLSADQSAGTEFIEVAHEALFESWPRLRLWLDQNRQFLLWRERLRFFQSEWERTGRNEAALLHGPLLEEAMRWLGKYETELTASEKEFILWTNTDEYQIASILPHVRDLLPYCGENLRRQWLETLAYAGRFEDIPLNAEGNQAISRVAQSWAVLGFGADAVLTATRIEDALIKNITFYNVANRLAEAGDCEDCIEAMNHIQPTSRRAAAAFYIGKTLAIAGLREQAFAASSRLSDSEARAILLKWLEFGRSVSATSNPEGPSFPTSEKRVEKSSLRKATARPTLVNVEKELGARVGIDARASNILKMIVALPRGSEQFRTLATKAQAAAAEIESARDRASYLCDVAAALLGNGAMRQARTVAVNAVSVVAELIAPRPTPLLRDLTTLLLKTGETKSAVYLVENEEEPEFRAMALRDAAMELRSQQKTRALRQVALRAMDAVVTAVQPEVKGSVFRDLVPILAVNARAKVHKAAGNVLESVAKMSNTSVRDELLSNIASVLAEAGMPNEALAAAKLIDGQTARAPVLRRVAIALSTARFPVEALEAANAIEIGYRILVLREIAIVLARQNLVAESLKAVSEIQDKAFRVQALSETATALSEAGATGHAIAAAESIEEQEMRDFSLSKVATAAAQAGRGEDAIGAATRIPNPAERYATLREGAEILAQLDRPELAASALARADEAVRQIPDEMERSEAWSQIALTLAQIGSYAEARLAAEQCFSLKHRITAYCGILREYAARRRPELRKIAGRHRRPPTLKPEAEDFSQT